MQAGQSATGASFVNASGAPLDMTEVSMTGYNKATYEGGSISVQQLTAEGGVKAGTYLTWWDDEDGTGWWDEGTSDWLEKGKIILTPGTGLWLTANSAEEKLLSAGGVITEGADVTLRAGQTLVANPLPTNVSFDNSTAGGKFIAVTGYNRETYEGGSISIQQLTAVGGVVAGSYFTWWDDEDGTGWWDEGTSDWVSGKFLIPGVAIWTTANSTDEEVSFPAL